jgi:hypothetical protein
MKRTQRTETSQYLQEKKSTETPLVAASESGQAQTQHLFLLSQENVCITSMFWWNNKVETFTSDTAAILRKESLLIKPAEVQGLPETGDGICLIMKHI